MTLLFLLLVGLVFAEPDSSIPQGLAEDGGASSAKKDEGLDKKEPIQPDTLDKKTPSTSSLKLAPLSPKPDPFAAPISPSGIVHAIVFSGRKRIDPVALKKAITLSKGDPVTRSAIRESLKGLMKTGSVDDVVVTQQTVADGQLITFHIVEKPAIRQFTYAGNNEFNEETLAEAVDILPLAIYNKADVQRCVDAIRAKYIEKGYYLVEISPVLTPLENDLVDLTFKITENQKVAVQKIEINGNENISDSHIKRFLQTRELGFIPLMGGGNFDESFLENDVQIIRSLFMEEGFADVKVKRPRIFLSSDKKYVFISIDVEEGPKYILGDLEVRGDFIHEEGLTQAAGLRILAGDSAKTVTSRWTTALSEGLFPIPDGWEQPSGLISRPSHPPLKKDDSFKLSTLQLSLKALTDFYGDQGYAFANVIPVTKPDKEKGIMNISFDIRRGKKVKISRIDITGNDPTYDKVIRREIALNEGELYSGTALEDARMRLQRLGFFETVNITTPKGDVPDELKMKVDVSEQPTGSFSVGAGFSNMENFMFNANISKNNFLGKGYIMSLATNISSIRQQGTLQLFDPYFLDTRWTLRVHGYSISRQFIEDEYQQGGSLAVGRYIDKRDDVRLEFDYTFENTGLTSIDSMKRKMLGGQLYRNGLTSTGGISLVADKRNNRVNATQGYFFTASFNLSGGLKVGDQMLSVFGGDFNFYETRFNFRAYYPLVKSGKLILKYNGTLGRLASTDGTVIPYIHRYRAGGINSVRGYNWYTLGPFVRAMGYNSSTNTLFLGADDPSNADDRLVIGGTKTFINNIELESPILPAAGVSLVAFFDAGNAFGDAWGVGGIDLTKLRMATGFGVRWLSPMGPLRFEWGFPINRQPDERAMVFDFSMGSLF